LEVTTTEALNRGILAQRKGPLVEAEQIYLSILIKFPSHPDAWDNLGVLVLGKWDEKRAQNYLRRSIAANPNVKQFWLSYLNTLVRLGNIAKAKQVFKQAEGIGITNDPFSKIRMTLGLTGNEYQTTSGRTKRRGSLSTKKVADKANVHKDTLLRWLRNGSIPEPQRDHRGWRKFSYAEVAAIIKFTQTGSSQTNIAIDNETRKNKIVL